MDGVLLDLVRRPKKNQPAPIPMATATGIPIPSPTFAPVLRPPLSSEALEAGTLEEAAAELVLLDDVGFGGIVEEVARLVGGDDELVEVEVVVSTAPPSPEPPPVILK